MSGSAHSCITVPKKRQPSCPKRERRQQQSGFTLLEILLTTAVLVIGLTAVFQTTRSALQSISAARELTEAQIACQTLLQELLAQSAPIKPDTGRAVAHLPHWKLRVDLYPAPQSRLYVLHLSAQQFSPLDGMLLGIRYQLIRWIPAERGELPAAQPDTPVNGNEFEDLFQDSTQ